MTTDAPALPWPERSDGVVVIRPIRVDEGAVHLAGEDAEIRRWFHFPRPSTAADVEAFIERSLVAFRTGGPRRTFGIVDAATGALRGHVEANHLGRGLVNLSYSVHPGARGRGLATRAVRLCMEDAVEALAPDRFVIRVEPGNGPSLGVAEALDFRFRRRHVEDGRLHWEYHRDLVAGAAEPTDAPDASDGPNATDAREAVERLVAEARRIAASRPDVLAGVEEGGARIGAFLAGGGDPTRGLRRAYDLVHRTAAWLDRRYEPDDARLAVLLGRLPGRGVSPPS